MTTVETTNGHVKGRAVPLPSFTFPDSGRTVQIKRVSPDTQAKIAQGILKDAEWLEQHPRPEPPVQAVETIEGPAQVANPDSPEYRAAMKAWMSHYEIEIGLRTLELALRRVVFEVDQTAVDELKADMAVIGTPFDDDADDRDIYLRQICVSSALDAAALVAFVRGTSQPTREAIQAALDMFQRAVSGSIDF